MTALVCAILLGGNGVEIEGDAKVDPARQLSIMVSPKGVDLRERFRGFAVADDYDDDERNCTFWLLTPNPCETEYKIAPFAFDGRVYGPVYFENPDEREPVTGGMEISPKKDLPPLSWKLVGRLSLAIAALGLLAAAGWFAVRYLIRRVKEHRMSPIERAWVELDRLLGRGLPGRGRYKDFYVELTMVVRRYVQRKYGIKAPHMTTEEFLREAKPSDELREFLESADMVKFAGVEATPDMADSATDSARRYLRSDSAEAAK